MRQFTTIRWRADGAWCTLLMVLLLGLVEPLACVAHCVWSPHTTPLHALHALCGFHPAAVVGNSVDVPAETHAATPRPYHELILLTALLLTLSVPLRVYSGNHNIAVQTWSAPPPNPPPIFA